MGIDLLLKVFGGYLLGSLSGSLLLGKVRGVDIRRAGSGNAGGTNALRTQGWWFALAVVVIDVGKGALAAGWLPNLTLAGATADPAVAAPACALAAIVGHNYPVFFGFRGGKGAATYIGGWLALLPAVLLPVLMAFLLILTASGYVGLSTMVAALVTIPATWYLAGGTLQQGLVVYATISAGLIIFAHRANILRMIGGRENRFSKVRLAYWLRRMRRE